MVVLHRTPCGKMSFQHTYQRMWCTLSLGPNTLHAPQPISPHLGAASADWEISIQRSPHPRKPNQSYGLHLQCRCMALMLFIVIFLDIHSHIFWAVFFFFFNFVFPVVIWRWNAPLTKPIPGGFVIWLCICSTNESYPSLPVIPFA